MSAAVLHKIGEIAGGVSVGRARHPSVFLIQDKRGKFDGKCSPLPLVAIASSSRAYAMCKVLPQSLTEILKDTNNSKKNATTSKLTPRVSICKAQQSVQGAVQVFGNGANLGASAKKFTAVVLNNACRYDYDFEDDYIRLGVHKAGFMIIDKALENIGYNSDRILVGVVRTLITADLDLVSSDSRGIVAGINVTEAGGLGVSGDSSKVEIDTGGHGVVAVEYTAFIFERVQPRGGENSPWNISKPFRVDSWDDPLFLKALSYCAKPSRFLPRRLTKPVKSEFVLDRVVEGPRRGLAMEQDMEDRKSQGSSAQKTAGGKQTLSTLHTSPLPRTTRVCSTGLVERIPPVSLGVESLPSRPQGPLVRNLTPQNCAIPTEVEPYADDVSVSSAVSWDDDTGDIRLGSNETTYYDALMGGAHEIIDTASAGSDASDAAVAMSI